MPDTDLLEVMDSLEDLSLEDLPMEPSLPQELGLLPQLPLPLNKKFDQKSEE